MKTDNFTPHQKTEIENPRMNSYGVGFVEWPEINFEEINHYDIENKMANVMYKGVVASLFMPQILIRAFYEVLRFKA